MQVALNIISVAAFVFSVINFSINLYEKARKLDVCCVTSSPRLKDTDIAYIFNLIISNKSVYPISITKMELIIDDKSFPFIQKTNKSSDCPLAQESIEFPFSLSAYNAENIHVWRKLNCRRAEE